MLSLSAGSCFRGDAGCWESSCTAGPAPRPSPAPLLRRGWSRGASPAPSTAGELGPTGLRRANRPASLLYPAEKSPLPPQNGLRCHVSLGSYPDAGVLGAGCGGAPAVPPAAPGGSGQGLQVGVVDVVVLLAAPLQRARERLTRWLGKSCRTNPNSRVRLQGWSHGYSRGPTLPCGGCQDGGWAAAAHPVPPVAPEAGRAPSGQGAPPGLALTSPGRCEVSAPRVSLLGGRTVVRAKRSRVPPPPSTALDSQPGF